MNGKASCVYYFWRESERHKRSILEDVRLSTVDDRLQGYFPRYWWL
jgi:hypothetical protein